MRMVLNNLNEGEISYHRLAENLPGIVYRVFIEDNNRRVFFNDMVQTMTGYGPEDLKTGEVYSIDPLILPEDKINVINTVKNAIKDEIPFEVEYRIKHKNGDVKWFIDRGKPIKGDNGKPSYINGVIFDITKRKRMELKLLETKNRYQFISENVNDMISILDEKMRYEFVNEQAFFSIMGRKKEELIGKSAVSWVHPKDVKKCRDVFEMGFETGKAKVEARFKDKNGDYHWFEIKGNLFIDSDGKKKGLTISRDIIEYKQLENDLENTIKKLDILNRIILSGNKAEDLTILLKNVLDSILKLMDFDGGAIYLVDETNRTAQIVYQKDIPLDFFDHAKKVKIDEGNYRKVFIEGVPLYTNNYPQINPERAKKWNILSLASIPLFTKDRIVGSLNIASKSRYAFTDDEKSLLQSIGAETGTIIEKMFVEQSLRESELNFKTLFNSLSDFLFVLNTEGGILRVNRSVFEQLKYSEQEIMNMNILDFHPSYLQNEVSVILRQLLEGKIDYCEFPLITKDGKLIPVETKVTRGRWNKKDVFFAISRDVTEKKEARQKLIESEEKFRNLFENAPDSISIVDSNGVIINCNKQEELLLGYNRGEIIGKNINTFHTEKYKNLTTLKMQEIQKTGHAEAELEIIRKNGQKIPIWRKGSAIKNENDQIKGIIAHSRDISERKKAELKLKESEENYRDLFENSPISLWEEDGSDLKNYIDILKNSGIEDFRAYFDKNPEEVIKCVSMIKIVDINKKTLEIYKANKKEDFFAGLGKVFTEESLYTFKELIINFARGKTRFESEAINLTLNGDKLYLFMVCEIVAGFKEDWSKVLISIVDISERKKAEQKLIESEEKFRTIAERTLMGILIIQDNQVKYKNEGLLKLFEYSQKEIADWEIDDLTKLIHSEDLSFLKEYREQLRSGDINFKPYNSYRVFTKSGKAKWIDQFSKEILYRGRSAELVTIIDITEKKEVEHELIKLNNLKSELLRRTSHELRTPLVSIKGFSDLLLELHRDKLDDYVIKTIEQIRGGCSRLEALVNEILKTAELESGMVQLEKSKGDLSLLIKLCVSELEGLSELRNHTINLDIPDKLICTFEKEKMHEVVSNLLSNAIKFTPPNGKIEVKSEINNDFIIVSISDTGIGFTEEERSLIFKQFGKIERYGQGYDVISEGSGLGLYISKRIVELHGGEIWLESEGRNKGSTLSVSLPMDGN